MRPLLLLIATVVAAAAADQSLWFAWRAESEDTDPFPTYSQPFQMRVDEQRRPLPEALGQSRKDFLGSSGKRRAWLEGPYEDERTARHAIDKRIAMPHRDAQGPARAQDLVKLPKNGY